MDLLTIGHVITMSMTGKYGDNVKVRALASRIHHAVNHDDSIESALRDVLLEDPDFFKVG